MGEDRDTQGDIEHAATLQEQALDQAEPLKARALPKPEEITRLARKRRLRGGQERIEISVKLEVVTPILGGGPVARELCDVDVIRVPGIRGHLRFWWRALYGHGFHTAAELFEAEGSLWGRAARDEGGRSAVDMHLNEIVPQTDLDEDDPTEGAYALWVARSKKERGRVVELALKRRKPGTIFLLTLRFPDQNFPISPTEELDAESVLRNVVRAWILFGGYGSRTRRGLGSLTVVSDTEEMKRWLPEAATPEAITKLFGRNIFASGAGAKEAPTLAGAALYVGNSPRDAVRAWTTAVDWLKEFRQGPRGGASGSAREPDPTGQRQRPSISNWPEADKIRHHYWPSSPPSWTWAHDPSSRHNATAVWPRAGFGLPIVGQFQRKSRNDQYWNPDRGDPREPPDFTLRWRSGNVAPYAEHERLASPLMLKALSLADGSFVPCALWLNRTLPAGAKIGIEENVPGGGGQNRMKPGTEADFDVLEDAPGSALFAALQGKGTLRDAFVDWLSTGPNPKATRIAP